MDLFYSTLFTIQISLFGIVAAIIIVYLQILISNSPEVRITDFLKSYALVSSLILALLAIFLTAAAFLLLSLKEYDFLPFVFVNSRNILNSGYFAVLCICNTGLSISFFLYYVIINFKYLSPYKTVLLFSRQIKNINIRNFMLTLKDIKKPERDSWYFNCYSKIPEGKIRDWATGKEELKEEDLQTIKVCEQENEIVFQRALSRYNQLINELGNNVEDPLAPIFSIIQNAIINKDTKIIELSYKELNRILDSFIKTIPQKMDYKEWNPLEQLSDTLVNYVIDNVQSHLELCRETNFLIPKKAILDFTNKIARNLYNKNEFGSIVLILRLWRQEADTAINNSSLLFTHIIGLYKNFGEVVLADTSKTTLLDEVFRHLGWLSERLLEKVKIEVKPRMYGNGYNNNLDEFIGVLIHFGEEYKQKYLDKYPLVFYDAVIVFVEKMVELYVVADEKQKAVLRRSMSNCYWIFYEIAKEMVSCGNSDGAALSILRLNGLYKNFLEKDIKEEAEEVFRLLIYLYPVLLENREKLKRVDFLEKTHEEYIYEIMVSTPFRSTLESEIFEMYIKHSLGDKTGLIWSFIVKLGNELRTNFNLNLNSK